MSILSSRSRIFAIGASAVAVLLSVTTFGTAANATGLGGTATPSDGTGTVALSGPQASTQPFTLALGAANNCTADSATGNTTWYSYMEPQFTVPDATVTVSAAGVTPGNGLYIASGSPAGADGSNHNTAVGGAVTQDIYSFSKTAIHVPGGIFAGGSPAVFEVGILCWNSQTSKVTDWWNAECTFTGTAASYTWQCVPGVPSTPPQTPEVPMAIALPIGGGLVLGGGAFITARRRRKTLTIA